MIFYHSDDVQEQLEIIESYLNLQNPIGRVLAREFLETYADRFKTALYPEVSEDCLTNTSDCHHERDTCRHWNEGLALLDALHAVFSLLDAIDDVTGAEAVSALRPSLRTCFRNKHRLL